MAMVTDIERNIGRRDMGNIKVKMTIERYNIGKISISKTSLNKTINAIHEAIRRNEPGYICVTNSRTTYLANHDSEYCHIQNNSFLTVPDGIPLVWIAHNFGHKEVERVSGPDLLKASLKISVKNGYSHYFYGSTPVTIRKISDNLKSKYPDLVIKGAISPPFQPIEAFDIEGLAKELNALKPTFFWCGLGAPKQERLIALLQPKLEHTICIGVGLAFEYLAGTIKRAPHWMQISGLEWFYRLSQQPQNIRRAIRPFSWVIKNLIQSYKVRWLNNQTQ
jgi:N-acetylglucosaminyldiphosphoundecaprenol N-acetyl-beta-D-mannosaminyltransferase